MGHFRQVSAGVLRTPRSNFCTSDEDSIVNALRFVARAGVRLDRQLSSILSQVRNTNLGERRGGGGGSFEPSNQFELPAGLSQKCLTDILASTVSTLNACPGPNRASDTWCVFLACQLQHQSLSEVLEATMASFGSKQKEKFFFTLPISHSLFFFSLQMCTPLLLNQKYCHVNDAHRPLQLVHQVGAAVS